MTEQADPITGETPTEAEAAEAAKNADIQLLNSMSLSEIANAAAERWKARDDAELDVRVAQRGGNDAETARAKAEMSRVSSDWYRATTIGKERAHAAIKEVLGVEPALFKELLR